MNCPYPHNTKLRDDLPPLTERLKKLPIDERGYPVPAFVQWIIGELPDIKGVPPGYPGGRPDFRIISPEHLRRCLAQDVCWVCGEKLGNFRAYVIGPMCTVNRTTAEPASHVDCAQWSVKGCPFLSKPKMKRREDDLTEKYLGNVPGIMEPRNPGIIAIWVVKREKKATLFSDGGKGVLIRLPDPLTVTWHREGREATTEEVTEAINEGVERLMKLCEKSPNPAADREEVVQMRAKLKEDLKL